MRGTDPCLPKRKSQTSRRFIPLSLAKTAHPKAIIHCASLSDMDFIHERLRALSAKSSRERPLLACANVTILTPLSRSLTPLIFSTARRLLKNKSSIPTSMFVLSHAVEQAVGSRAQLLFKSLLLAIAFAT